MIVRLRAFVECYQVQLPKVKNDTLPWLHVLYSVVECICIQGVSIV